MMYRKLEKKDCLPEVVEVEVIRMVNRSAEIDSRKNREASLLINQQLDALCLLHSMNKKNG